MTRILLVPDLPLERWPSMDRYASRLETELHRYAPDLDITVASEIATLTTENGARRPLPKFPTPGLNELRRYLSRYWLYPRRVWRKRADLVHVLDHSYAHILRGKRDRPAVVTVHDLLPVMTLRRGGTKLRHRFRAWLLERVLDGLKNADAWIVATEWLRSELAEWLDREEPIHVIPYGVDDKFFDPPADSRAIIRGRWNIPESAFVVLHVGSVGPRKNLPTVFAAVHGLRKGGIEAWLLQVGGELTPEQHADLSTRGIDRFVRSIGEAAEPELRAAYRAADVLLFPSHSEGFGFPVLEAMAAELPVVTSGAGGLAEVAGDAAVVIGGREPEPYVAALKRLVGNATWQSQLVAKGRERARRFRWVETARRTAEVYRRLV